MGSCEASIETDISLAAEEREEGSQANCSRWIIGSVLSKLQTDHYYCQFNAVEELYFLLVDLIGVADV